MSHNLLGQRFYNNRLEPAWHGLGINDPSDHSAADALHRIGKYGVRKEPLYHIVGGKSVESGWYSIVRDAIPEDPQERVISTSPVSAWYEIIDPIASARLYDENVLGPDGNTAPIETMGILGRHGDRTFICTKLPTFAVKGDETATYLLFDSPMENNASYGVYTTGVRTVCQNTLRAGIAAASERLTAVTHTEGAKAQIAKWLNGVYGRALEASQQLEQAYTVLADKPLSVPAVKWIITNTYVKPPMPEEEAPAARLPFEERVKIWDTYCQRIDRLRTTVFELYEGRGTGMDHPALAGTAYGAYNAVAECETYRAGGLDAAVGSLIYGNRAARIQNAFALAMVADRHETVAIADLELANVFG